MDKAFTSDDLVDIGEQHHQAGRLTDAESNYRKALEIDPGHPGALYFLASIAYEDGRLDFAVELVDELLRENASDAEAWHLLGMLELKKNEFAKAEECFKRALAIQPVYIHAIYGLGTACSQAGNLTEALASFRRAVSLDPGFAEAYCSIANIYRVQQDFGQAASSYRRAIELRPGLTIAYESLGDILLAQEKWDEAIAVFNKAIMARAASALVYGSLATAFLVKDQYEAAASSCERALELEPDCFVAHFNLGNALFKQAKIGDAIQAFRRAVALNSQDTRLLANFAHALYSAGEIESAAEIYRQWQVLEPDNPIAKHHLAACTSESIPLRADDAYVEHTFDAFAESFDSQLTALGYAPRLLTEGLERIYGLPRKEWLVLDAGCGTGLCGPLVAPYAKRLVGVDLSAGMLEKARARDVYDELLKGELTAYLQSQVDAFDIILSGDTLVYFGALEEVLSASYRAMRSNGCLLFTVESLTDENPAEAERGYRISPHGRYSHTERYLKRVLNDQGFTNIHISPAPLRQEYGRFVQGFVVSAIRPPLQ